MLTDGKRPSPQRHSARQLHRPIRWNARVFGIAAVVRHPEVVADRQHRVALGKARIGRGNHRTRQVDAADARRAAQDPSLARRGERVLEVDVGVRDTHHHFARVEFIERALDECRLHALVDLGDSVSLELFHGSPRENSSAWFFRSADIRRPAFRSGG